MALARRRPAPTARLHPFSAAENEPAAYDGRQVCSWCGKPGRVGDAQHPVEASRLDAASLPEVPAEVRALEARRLGEGADG